MARLSSNADIFRRRGNPWMSEKDQDDTRLHRREPMTAREVAFAKVTGKAALTPIVTHPIDPDMDRWTKAGFREERFEKGEDKPILAPSAPSDRQRIANISREFHKKTNSRTVNVQESEFALKARAKAREAVEQQIRVSRPPTGFSVYILYADGSEEERDRPTKAKADLLFARMRRRREVRGIEIWSYVSGDMIAGWERK